MIKDELQQIVERQECFKSYQTTSVYFSWFFFDFSIHLVCWGQRRSSHTRSIGTILRFWHEKNSKSQNLIWPTNQSRKAQLKYKFFALVLMYVQLVLGPHQRSSRWWLEPNVCKVVFMIRSANLFDLDWLQKLLI